MYAPSNDLADFGPRRFIQLRLGNVLCKPLLKPRERDEAHDNAGHVQAERCLKQQPLVRRIGPQNVATCPDCSPHLSQAAIGPLQRLYGVE